jgi:hypothetical protein
VEKVGKKYLCRLSEEEEIIVKKIKEKGVSTPKFGSLRGDLGFNRIESDQP